MQLNPSIAPGRPNRKARAFTVEIARLVMNGYGCKAIHQALIDAGLRVSKSTVQREVARLRKVTSTAPHGTAAPIAQGAEQPGFASAPSPISPRLVPADDVRSGKDLAAAFMNGRITNPFFRNRS